MVGDFIVGQSERDRRGKFFSRDEATVGETSLLNAWI